MVLQKDVEVLTNKRKSDIQAVSVRIPMDMLRVIDQAVAQRKGLNRHAWILEALQEKLEGKQISTQYPGDISSVLVLKNSFSANLLFKLIFKPCKFITFYNPLR
jgi:metal-responsive CopG/Arc/MetJ family transcriptional regulator